MITHTDLTGVDEDLARRVLVLARSIAPCIDAFTAASEEGKNAIAILKGVIAEIPAAGSRRTKSMSRNGTSITLADIGSAFDDDSRAALRTLCSAATPSGLPVGSFPTPDYTVASQWPETYA